jgi:hypothetical protein
MLIGQVRAVPGYFIGCVVTDSGSFRYYTHSVFTPVCADFNG